MMGLVWLLSSDGRTWLIFDSITQFSTYDHSTMRIRLPVRSAIYKHCTGGLVPRWVTTRESPLLYVFRKIFFLPRIGGAPNYLDLSTAPSLHLCFCVLTSTFRKQRPLRLLHVLLLTVPHISSLSFSPSICYVDFPEERPENPKSPYRSGDSNHDVGHLTNRLQE